MCLRLQSMFSGVGRLLGLSRQRGGSIRAIAPAAAGAGKQYVMRCICHFFSLRFFYVLGFLFRYPCLSVSVSICVCVYI